MKSAGKGKRVAKSKECGQFKMTCNLPTKVNRKERQWRNITISNIPRAIFSPKRAFVRHSSPFRRNAAAATQTHTHTTTMHNCFRSAKTLDPTGN